MEQQPGKQIKYWFKRRRYGFGWIPVTWEGWLTLLVFIGVVVWAAFQLPAKPATPTHSQTTRFVIIVALALIGLVLTGMLRGPKPRWRWGKKDSDNPDEDF